MTTVESYRPVFIGGCERSGTTMLGAMLGSSPDTLTTPESQFVVELLPRDHEAISGRNLEQMIAGLCGAWRLKIWGIKNLETRMSRALPPNAKYRYQRVISQVVRLYAEDVSKTSASLWIDHTPTHVKFVDRLLTAFPDARFIHLVRDGRAVALSLRQVTWGRTTAYKAAEWWSKMVCLGAAAEARYGPSRVMRVRYEDLVTQPETMLREICHFAQIDFTKSMIEGQGFCVLDYTKHQHALVGSPPDARRVTEWRARLTPREVELFEYRSGDILRYFDYELEYGASATAPTRLELTRILCRETMGRIHHRLVGRRRVMKVKRG